MTADSTSTLAALIRAVRIAGPQVILCPRREASRIRRLIAPFPRIEAVYGHDYLPPGQMYVMPMDAYTDPSDGFYMDVAKEATP